MRVYSVPWQWQFCFWGVGVLWPFISMSPIICFLDLTSNLTQWIVPVLQLMKPRLRLSQGPMIIPRSTFQEVAASGRVPQPESKSHISSLCQDSHPQRGEHEASFPARKAVDSWAILTSSHTLNTGRGRGGKEERKEGREGKNTSNFFICFHVI